MHKYAPKKLSGIDYAMESLSYKFVGALIRLYKSPTWFQFDVFYARVIQNQVDLDLLPPNPRVNISILFAWDDGLVVHRGFQGVCMYPIS